MRSTDPLRPAHRRACRAIPMWLASAAAVFFLLPPSQVVEAAAPPTPAFTIVLDPAHGGADTGARLADGAAEKDANLSLSLRLRTLLEERGFNVVLTRSADIDLPADRRAGIANRARAQACLVLHATATGSGLHLFNSSLAPLDDARPAQFQPWDTAQAAGMDRSIALAGEINSAFGHAAIPVTLGRTFLSPLDNMTCPAVAVEVAPLIKNSHDRLDADHPEYQQRVAETLAWALLQWRSHATGATVMDQSLNPQRPGGGAK